MPATNNVDWKRQILARLYDQKTAKPSAYTKLRLAPDQYPPEDVEQFFEELVSQNLIRGSVRRRNLKLTSRGVDYVEDNYPEILDAG